ncbi:AAA family ATPase [Leptolyngbya cf. ectocarpi LEGE 11479]|uniref:AAA family ATPase n=1 Tax=Leptolyngbya cf. ectocarpi LEGE 11479 TaxID=1828722 RepID=A0A928ZSD5_LEPEC|nr:NB-ARC domain-containing protein [Leptolyngbya ectocarpi]MBE9066057.1 AAA family ATPase [Leptolyngbya cf. ectocarpi LEGE 11479]
MTVDEALALLERRLDTEYLSKTQIDIFRKVWDGHSYVTIATTLGYEHGYVKDAGAQLWRLLSKVFGKKVSKSNVRNILCNLSHQAVTNQTFVTTVADPRQNWGESVDIEKFYGRAQEQSKLATWLVEDSCRLVSILGIGGVGKTALAVKVARQVQSQFDYVAWRTLRQAPPLSAVLPELILFFSEQQDTQISDASDKQIEQVLNYLRQKRCLLVLDNFESILQTGDRTGKYRQGYEDYDLLLERIADADHQSCLMITSREKPMGLTYREMDGRAVRSHRLTGLTPTASQEILSTVGIHGSNKQHQQLINRYSGNPLALKIIAATIRSVFAGEVADFLEYGTIVFGDLWDLLDQQFNRLSAMEQTVMRWLAINREWTTLKELRADIVPAVSHRALLEAVESLKARSLVETSRAGITQQPVVMEYMTERLVEQFYQEIAEQNCQLFSQYALLKANAKEFIREAQIRQLSQPLLEKLCSTHHPAQPIERQLQQLLTSFKYQTADNVGYAGGNLLNLLCQLDVDLQGQDFSHLPLWQTYLSGKNLQGVNLAHADLSKSVFSESLGSAISVAFSPDGQLLAAGDTNGEIHIWNATNGQEILSRKGHTGWIWSVAFSPKGRQLASGAEDQTIKIWDVTTGQLITTLMGHNKRVSTVVWHPDGQQLMSGSEDSTVKVWDWATSTCVKTLTHETGIDPIALSADEKMLASGSPVANSIYLWDVEHSDCVSRLEGHGSGLRSLTFTPDNQTLISASIDKTIRLWNLETGDCLRILTGHQAAIWSVVVSDNQQIVSASEDQTVRIWDMASGQCLRTLHGFAARVWDVALDSQSSVLASCDNQAVKLWDMTSGQCLKTFRGYPQVNWTVSFSPTGYTLASGGQDQMVRIWDVESSTCIQSLSGHDSYVHTLCHHPTEPVLACGAGNIIYLWNLETGQQMCVLEGHQGQVWKVVLSRDGQRLASTCFDQTVKVWDWRTGHCLLTLQGHSSWVFGADFSPDGQWLATSSIDKTIRVWDISTGECLRTIAIAQDYMPDLAFSPDGNYLVGGGSQGLIMMWTMDANTPPRVIQGHGGFIGAVRFSPDGKTLVSSSHDQTIKLWDAATFDCLKTLVGHENMVSAVAFSTDGTMVASASHDETVRMWDVATGKCLKVLRAPRPYEGMNIEGATGLADSQKKTLQILGAVKI